MINFHPCETHLKKFAEGALPSAESLVISAHCDMCQVCSSQLECLTEDIASGLFSGSSSEEEIERDLISMFHAITSAQKSPTGISKEYSHYDVELTLDGRSFVLPPTLRRFVDNIGGWSHLLGKLWQAPIDIGGGCLAQLLYMEKGGGVPEHTHKGNEYTLVINGQFIDGSRSYASGDFISLNNAHTHAPISESDEGCLVFIIIDQPLHFTSGWAKLMNPLSQLYFKAKT